MISIRQGKIIKVSRKGKTKNFNICLMVIICLGCILPGFDAFAFYGKGGNSYMNNEAHFSVALPVGFHEISKDRLRGSSLDPKLKSLCKDALEKYDKIFIRRGNPPWLPVVDVQADLNQSAKSLALLGIKTYEHKKKRFKFFTDSITMNEFFDSRVIKKFSKLLKKQLGEKGAKNIIVGNPVINKDNRNFGFTCAHRLSNGIEAKEFHRVFLGRTHLIYLDLNLYAVNNVTPYESLFTETAASLSFKKGYEPKRSYGDAFKKKVRSYELFGKKLPDLATSLVSILLIVVVLNFVLEYITNPKKGRYIYIKYLQSNKGRARLSTIVIGVLIYIFSS